jgi:dipeptidyl aminopeptidase/acylaminoacyl peptidase
MPDAAREPLRDLDLLAFEFVGDPQLSPDGRQVAYTRTTMDAKENAYRSQIHVVPADGSAPPKALTGGPKRDSQPRYSPDGRYLAFVSDREADATPGRGEANDPRDDDRKLGSQVYILPLAGGEARRVTDVLGGVAELAWSPDSKRLAFVARIKPGGVETLRGAAEGGQAKPDPDSPETLYAKYNKDVRDITRIRYRLDGFGWFEDRRAHVFVVDVEQALAAEAASLPAPVQVTGGPYDHHSPAWSPDGRRIAVAACRAPDADQARFTDVWIFPADGSAAGGPGYDAPRGGTPGGGPGDPPPAPRPAASAAPAAQPVKVTASDGNFGAPVFSPDGSALAMLGHTRPKSWYSDTRLWVADLAPDGSARNLRCLTADHPRAFGDQSISDMRTSGGEQRPAWSPDGRQLFMLASDRGTTHLYRIDAASGEVRRLTSGDVVLFDASVNAARGRAAFAVARPDNPNDIYVADLAPDVALPALADPLQPGGLPLRPLTRCNEDLLARRRVVMPERLTARAEGGPEIDVWAWKPLDAQPGRAYPTVLEIHGGPMAMYTGTFFLEFQLLLARGIGVVITNPRGSQGYGQDFCAGILNDWGNHDYADIMAGLDAALARLPWIDRERLGVAGGSYGGYMTAWIIGHTQRFKAACVMRPVTNCYSFFGSSDGGYLWDEVWGRGMPPWENPEDYLRQSPIAYAGHMRTPTLIIHSEQDYRCLVEQAEQLYVALKKQGVEAELLRYPGESHGLSRGGKPWHRVHRLRAIVGWFAGHL